MLQASIATFKVMNTLYSMMRVAQSPSAWELVVRIMWCLHSSHWWRSSALQISAVIGVLVAIGDANPPLRQPRPETETAPLNARAPEVPLVAPSRELATDHHR